MFRTGTGAQTLYSTLLIVGFFFVPYNIDFPADNQISLA